MSIWAIFLCCSRYPALYTIILITFRAITSRQLFLITNNASIIWHFIICWSIKLQGMTLSTKVFILFVILLFPFLTHVYTYLNMFNKLFWRLYLTVRIIRTNKLYFYWRGLLDKPGITALHRAIIVRSDP